MIIDTKSQADMRPIWQRMESAAATIRTAARIHGDAPEHLQETWEWLRNWAEQWEESPPPPPPRDAVVDSRILNAYGDAKAAAAAADDARCRLYELLHEGPELEFLDREAIELDLEVLNTSVSRINAVIGSLDRLADRWTA
ncbi:hypothetical protein PBI_SQUIRTY_64 [Mycobacterium phage Squirty]|uniref:Uncharacterized protein n=3 Tax=Gracegardnervirinae TaxID=2946632 RepID=A0A4Y5NYM4_9CAUD|nr:hypothetical protein PBI_SQUIRTY_64 [Mycobacterium phage Squirty]YP_009954747.1 hypothetical protein I5H15_gp060 [Mycobacterium phage Blexus]YP_009961465.1 hypothetical protein I5H80_gp060 [Mycobacterium phage Polka14]UVK63049.1 hypothetical protein SEA_BEAKIN_63 [Mycobacterium phage Beakin]WNM65171.1 hypothetical protein SEA_STAP_59 [Mycobacterium phage Stap]AIM41011.1 hypothetical protein PBI_SQUIRTY_64 [Mycobacterium phage Squirty]QCW22138.1 hypothetical protein SEA_POLKA14_60 [Mycobact